MAVYDRRAHQAITQLGLILSHKPGRYARYMAIIDELQAGCARRGTKVGAHQVDIALFSIGG